MTFMMSAQGSVDEGADHHLLEIALGLLAAGITLILGLEVGVQLLFQFVVRDGLHRRRWECPLPRR